MNSLFDKLMTEKHSASHVDATSILNKATNGGKGYARRLVKLCIIQIILPPHSTHHVQPLDLRIFRHSRTPIQMAWAN